MTPYAATALEVAATFGGTPRRQALLRGWLAHRAAMRATGFGYGFQWLDGSFVEAKQPQDLDVVTFLYRPPGVSTAAALSAVLHANPDLFQSPRVRKKYGLDLFPIDLDGSPEGIVASSRYFLGLFSHRRGDNIWKGMIEVRLDDAGEDDAALAALGTNLAEQERMFQ